ncbi:MAG: dTMP kinase [Bacillota bacterium]|nr:dTMP kinase [Bacillota bacterium]
MSKPPGRGRFITLEGIDGAGKSTQLALLKEFVTERWGGGVFTREPGGTSLSEHIRQLLLDPAWGELAGQTEILLYSAARAQLVAEVIRPALARGLVVVCERYVDSTLAYQGYGLGYDLEQIGAVNALATSGLWPDVTFLLDIDPVQGLQRAGRSDRVEQRGLEFHRRVREGYLQLARAWPERIVVVEVAGRSPAEIQAEIRAELARRWPE